MNEKRNIIIILLIISLVAFILLVVTNLRDSPVNLNTASKEALESLPGIGEVLSQRIIDNRPYKDVYELDKVKGIGPKTINLIKDKVVVQ